MINLKKDLRSLATIAPYTLKYHFAIIYLEVVKYEKHRK